MKRLNILLVGAALALPLVSQAAVNKGIEGSVHDFSNVTNNTWNTRSGVCSPCHAAHHTDPQQVVPLWVHATSTAAFQMYSSPTMDAAVSTTGPTGSSLACLSCHDGTVAINASISSSAPASPVFIDEAAQIGPDLHTTHPISFVYDAALAALDGSLENPVTYKIGDTKSILTVNNPPIPSAGWAGTSLTGKSIDDALLINHKMECSSCHDVHKLVGSAPSSGILVKISGNDINGRGSLICRTCHIK
ncbi:MAG TPA: hypothetical protein VN673_11875 [Clostridia bacterium]|nr:hypothetical protein [Clostridia bacterium]